MLLTTKCPHCLRVNEMHAGRDLTHDPVPGSVSVCFGCTRLSVFTKYGLRTPTDAEQEQFDQEPVIMSARRAVARALSVDDAVQQWRATTRR